MAFDELDELLGGASRERPRKDGSERPTIVAVDDDRDILRGFEGLFSDRYNLVLCSSGREALAALNEEICAIILDVRMAGMDGFAVCEWIRVRYPSVPVIFYSAYQDSKDPYRIINQYRPFAYITKGDNVSKLTEAVHLAVRLQWSILTNQRLVANLKKGRPRP